MPDEIGKRSLGDSTGVKLAPVDLDNGEVQQGILTGFGREDDEKSPDELLKDTLLLRSLLSGNLMAQDPEFLQPILRLLQILLRLLALLHRHEVAHALNRLDPLLSIGDRGLLAPNIIVDGGELLIETGGDKDDPVFTGFACVRALL